MFWLQLATESCVCNRNSDGQQNIWIQSVVSRRQRLWVVRAEFAAVWLGGCTCMVRRCWVLTSGAIRTSPVKQALVKRAPTACICSSTCFTHTHTHSVEHGGLVCSLQLKLLQAPHIVRFSGCFNCVSPVEFTACQLHAVVHRMHDNNYNWMTKLNLRRPGVTTSLELDGLADGWLQWLLAICSCIVRANDEPA